MSGDRIAAYLLLLLAGVPAGIIVSGYVGRATGSMNLDLVSGVITLVLFWVAAHLVLTKDTRK